jgi:sec-independent protein translocase protein TatC
MPDQITEGFWGHFGELVKRLKVVLATFIVAAVSMFVLPANLDFFQNLENYQPWVSVFLKSVRERVLPQGIKLIALQMTDPIELYVIAAFMFSIGITMPVLAYEAYKFINPALHENEKKQIYPFITAVTILFVTGASFGFFILFPLFVTSMFPFFTAVGAEIMFSIMDFYNVLFFTVIASGLVFTIPAFFVLLVKFGIIQTKTFTKKRKWVYLGLGVLAMFISPSASPQGDVFLFLPLLIMFEVSLFLGKRYERNGITPIKFFSTTPNCKHCGTELKENSVFCSRCKRSQM